MHEEDLKNVWICGKCKMRFVFRSDINDHKSRCGHSILQKYDLTSGRLLDVITI